MAINGRKRGQKRNNIDRPQRFLDHLTPAVSEKQWEGDAQHEVKKQVNVLTLDKLFNRSYIARKASGMAERTLDYVKHMKWLRAFLA